MKDILNLLNEYDENKRLNIIWDILPINQYCNYVNDDSTGRKQYQVCGKIIQDSMFIKYAKNIIQTTYDRYGIRAKQAETNSGIDWKAISHAFRAGLQLKEIYQTNDLIYPLKDAKFLTELKIGQYNYINDNIDERLNNLLLEIEQLSVNSKLPDNVDQTWINDFIINQY